MAFGFYGPFYRELAYKFDGKFGIKARTVVEEEGLFSCFVLVRLINIPCVFVDKIHLSIHETVHIFIFRFILFGEIRIINFNSEITAVNKLN